MTWTCKQPVGKLKLTDNFMVYVYKKPSLLHRFMYRFLLGWEYEEGDAE